MHMQSTINRVFLFIVLIFFAGEAGAQQSVLTTVAGTGTAGYNGDGMQATAAQLNGPYDVAVDPAGNLYIAEWYNSRVRKITPAGVITTIAGTGGKYYSGDGGDATSADLNSPEGIAADDAGN